MGVIWKCYCLHSHSDIFHKRIIQYVGPCVQSCSIITEMADYQLARGLDMVGDRVAVKAFSRVQVSCMTTLEESTGGTLLERLATIRMLNVARDPNPAELLLVI